MRIGVLAILLVAMVCSITAHGQANGTQKAMANDLQTKYFSADYEEARKKLIDASQAAGASIEGSVDDVRQEVRRVMQTLGPGSGCMIGAVHAVMPGNARPKMRAAPQRPLAE